MDELWGMVTQVTDLMEQDNRGVQLGCYSVALAGLTIALKRVRPFTRFKKPSDIPNHFIRDRRELTGKVERIDPNGGILMIRHKPLVELPGLPTGELPVKISGVHVSGLGLSWLQTIVAGNQVKFVPVAKEKDCVQCEVLLPQITRDKKHHLVNVGESLVKVGFGKIVDRPISSSSSSDYVKYRNQLMAAQTYALKKELGVKYYAIPTKSALIAFVKLMKKFVVSSVKRIAKIPKLAPS